MAIRYLSGVNIDSNTLFVDDVNNRVGIGTASPSYRLDLNVTSNSDALRIQQAGAQRFILNGDGVMYWGNGASSGVLTWDNNIAYIGGLTNNALGIWAGGSEKVRITTGGNVGIGITSPANKLSIGSTQDGGIDFLYDSFNNYKNQIKNYWNSGTDTRMDFNIGNSSGVTPVTIMSVGYAGNVGIGTTSPAQKLHVVGNTTITGVTYTDVVQTYSGASIDFRHQDASVVMRVDTANARVGIGTTSPSGKLSISTPNAYDGTILQLQSRDEPTVFNLKINEVVSAGVVRWSFDMTNGSAYNNVLVFDRGNVGIGTTSPNSKLAVRGGFVSAGADDSNYAFIGADGSGVGYAGTFTNNNFQLRVNNSARLTIDTSGNVGIGTTSPLSKLQVRAGLDQNFRVASSTNLTVASINDADSAYAPITFRASTFDFQNGNVGIGTASPAYKLDVAGTISNNSAQNIIYASYDAVAALFQRVGTYGGVIQLGRSGVSNSTTIDYPADGTFAVSTASSERMRITAAGNVGIGTTSPVTTLQVNATSPAIRLQETGSGGDKRLELSVNSSGVATIAANQSAQVLTFETVGSERMRIASTGATRLNAYGSGSFTGTVAYNLAVDSSGNIIETAGGVVDGSGTANYVSKWQDANTLTNSVIYDDGTNVGIGTTTPATKLDVSGGITGGPIYTTSRFIVNSTANPGISDISLGSYVGGSWLNTPVGTTGYLSVAGSAAFSYSSTNLIWYTDSGGGISEKMRITAAGNVGIGTTSPSYSLDVAGTSRSDLHIFRSNQSAPTADAFIFRPADNTIALGTANAERMRILSNGDVAIGATYSIDHLYVSKTAGSSIGIGTGGIAGTTASPLYTSLNFRGYGDYIKGQIQSYDVSSNAVGGLLTFSVQDTGATLTERMRITSAGNVGVGTTSPAQKLDVIGVGVFGTMTSSRGSYSNGLSLQNNTGEATSLFLWQSGVASAHIGSPANSTSLHIVNSYNTGLITDPNSIVLTNTGNVGIGTDAPTQKLHVSGNVRVTGAYYDSSNSAGSSGQVLSSTGSGTDWVSLSEISGVDGTGTANYVAKWSDADTIANSQIRDDGTTVGIGQAPAAAKVSVNGSLNAGGRYLYHNFQSSLDTTGVAVAGLSASTNGDSAFFTFEAGASDGQYQRIVWSCYNAAGTWNVVKVIDEGSNGFDVVASASSGATITFTWKSRSGIRYFTPRLIITGVGSINTSYL